MISDERTMMYAIRLMNGKEILFKKTCKMIELQKKFLEFFLYCWQSIKSDENFSLA